MVLVGMDDGSLETNNACNDDDDDDDVCSVSGRRLLTCW